MRHPAVAYLRLATQAARYAISTQKNAYQIGVRKRAQIPRPIPGKKAEYGNEKLPALRDNIPPINFDHNHPKLRSPNTP